MISDRWILIIILVVSVIAVFILVPRTKIRDAWVIFLSLQVITWPAGLFAVEMKWIEYPIQLFAFDNHFNRSSLTFEFFLFPVTAIIFNLYFPIKQKKWTILYYLVFTGFFTGLEVLLERYTDLVQYHKWKWYWTLITVIASLFINRHYYKWFKKDLIEVKKTYE